MRTRFSSTLALVLALTLGGGAVAEIHAQTPFIPYFGKNKIRYDNFDWYIYKTDHFEIYYYPALEKHLERVASYAESAYQKVSADLKHDLAFKVPLIVYKTHSEFEETNLFPGFLPEGIAAFAEPVRDRMILPIDEPSDRLFGLITHELTHVFEFDIIPRSLIRRQLPLWVDEGLSDYEREVWDPLDLMMVRDAAVTDQVPKMTEDTELEQSSNPRLPYNLGHALFEFMESKWGKDGIRQYLFALRKNIIGGGDDAYEQVFHLKPEEFDEQFSKYLKDRFKPFRDKQRPADYGRDLSPKKEKTRFMEVFAVAPSPSGDLIAALSINRKDRELDIILLSAKDGSVVRNLTPGFDKDKGFEYISVSPLFTQVPLIAWAPKGDMIAFFVRTEKKKSLALMNVLNGHIDRKIEMKAVDEPESPQISPDGKSVIFAALQNGIGDIFQMDLATEQTTNLTNDPFDDRSPAFSPDAKTIVYAARISGNQKLFKLDLASKQKTQLTFGTHDDMAPHVDPDGNTVYFASTAVDPNQPIDPNVAKNGNIFNIWSLDLRTGALKQFTDALGGNLVPAVLKPQDGKERVAFISYFKGDWGLYTIEPKDALKTAQTTDFGSPGPIIDFQAPVSHTLVAANKRKKGMFEKLFLEGRPPVNVGITSGGDLFGGSEVTFGDVLGDQQFNLFAASISQYRTLSFSYVNLANRFQWAAQGFSQTLFFFGLNTALLGEASFFLPRDRALATRTVRGAIGFGIYPLDTYRRVELSAGLVQYSERFTDLGVQAFGEQLQQQARANPFFRNGTFVPLGVALVQETTIFREFGPLAGNTFRLSYEVAPHVGSTLSRQTADGDLRYYLKLGGASLLALRARGFRSWGDFPDFLFFGGNSEVRGYPYLNFVGNRAFFGNAELRFPLIDAMLTPAGVLGAVRGVFFFNIGGAAFNGQPLQFFSGRTEQVRPIAVDAGGQPLFQTDAKTGQLLTDPKTGDLIPILGKPITISGFRLKDARASYGIGLEMFAFGFPIHFDWAWRTLFNRDWERVVSQNTGLRFRKAKFSFWIGYDF